MYTYRFYEKYSTHYNTGIKRNLMAKKKKQARKKPLKPVVASGSPTVGPVEIQEDSFPVVDNEDEVSLDIDDVKENEEFIENAELEGPIGESTKEEEVSVSEESADGDFGKKQDDVEVSSTEIDGDDVVVEDDDQQVKNQHTQDIARSNETEGGDTSLEERPEHSTTVEITPEGQDQQGNLVLVEDRNIEENTELDSKQYEVTESLDITEISTSIGPETSTAEPQSVPISTHEPEPEPESIPQLEQTPQPEDTTTIILEPTEDVNDDSISEQTELKVLSINNGPYSISEFIASIDLHDESIPDSKGSYPTYIENYKDNIYIGTSIGEILHYQLDSSNYSLSLKSRSFFHQARRYPIKKILMLKSISKALILSGNLTSCFNLPSLEPSNIGRIKDVNDISLDFNNQAKNDASGVHCVIFAMKQIRIINVTNESLRLVKDISYAGIIKGLRRGKFAAVANAEFYDLIDLDNFSKIPLFPVSTGGGSSGDAELEGEKLQPFIVPVAKDEFLLTCGTMPEEPAMGIVININGDVSRGTFSFDSYPLSIEVDKDESESIVVGFKNCIKVYSLETQVEVQCVEFEENLGDAMLQVGKFDEFVNVKDDELVDLIKLVPLIGGGGDDNEELEERLDVESLFAKKISKTNSKVYFLNGGSVNLLKPVSKLFKLNEVKDLQLLLLKFNAIQMINNSNELNFVELEYLNLLIVITGLETNVDDELFWESLINGTVDPRIFCHIMGFKIFGGDIWIFNGISTKLESFKNKRIKTTKINKLFQKFLDHWIKKKQTNNNEVGDVKDFNILKTLELIKLDVLTKENDHHKISEFVNTSNVSNYEESSNLLMTSPLSVANIHIKKHEYKKAINLYKMYHDDLKSTTQQNEILVTITDLVCTHYEDLNDLDYVNQLGLWLIKKNAEIGLNFLQNKKLYPGGGFRNDKEFELVINNVEDDSVKFEYIQNILVSLNREKFKINIVKNLKRFELRKLDSRLKRYKK